MGTIKKYTITGKMRYDIQHYFYNDVIILLLSNVILKNKIICRKNFYDFLHEKQNFFFQMILGNFNI